MDVLVELIKGPQYAFWSHGFTRLNDDIAKLFESVSRSVPSAAQQARAAIGGGGGAAGE